jgi:hypothetical protein
MGDVHRRAELDCWGEDVNAAARQALAEILEGRMALAVDRHLAEIARRGEADRRNGGYERSVVTGLGDVAPAFPAPAPSVRRRC